VRRAYITDGLVGVVHALATDDSIEHALSRLGAEITLLRTGDYTAFRDLCSCEPPGQAEVLPSWSLDGARDRSKQLHLQRARNTSGGGQAVTGADDEDDAVPSAPRRRKRPPRRGAGEAAAGGLRASSTSAKAPGGGKGGPGGGGSRQEGKHL